MLFSDKKIADYINNNFEPVWQSVRPVPIVHIDFGNGQVLTRTLHGNIATYVCNGQGQVLDILPGIYQPEVYLDRLQQFFLLAKFAGRARGAEQLQTTLVSYHTSVARELEKNLEPSRFVDVADFSKVLIERGTKVLFLPGGKPHGEAVPTAARPASLNATADLANWKALLEDTTLNESERREKIHTILAASKLTTPKEVTKWLYREVLHADLDDPYLGLGPTLFGSYPFKDQVSMKP